MGTLKILGRDRIFYSILQNCINIWVLGLSSESFLGIIVCLDASVSKQQQSFSFRPRIQLMSEKFVPLKPNWKPSVNRLRRHSSSYRITCLKKVLPVFLRI